MYNKVCKYDLVSKMKKQISLFIVFIFASAFLSLLPNMSQALASNYYVATSGSDSNNGAIGTPFKTIQKAASLAVAGDVVNISPGTYAEQVSPANSGGENGYITFRGTGEGVIIDGTAYGI